MDIKKVKAKARKNLKGNYLTPVLAIIIYLGGVLFLLK